MHVADVRGWGYLTGQGAANLGREEADKIFQANARLIAAAPELFRSLKVAVAVARDRHQRSVERAVAMARGQRFDYMYLEPLPDWVRHAEAAIAEAEGRS